MQTCILTDKGNIVDQYPYQVLTEEEVKKYNNFPYDFERLQFLNSLRRITEIMVIDNKINWITDKVLHLITY